MRGKRLAIKILVYLAFIAWLAGIVFLVGYRARHPIDDSYGAQRNQRQAQNYVVGVQETHAEPYGKETGDHQNYAAKWTEPIIIITTLLFGVAVVAAYVYYGQLKEMRKTVALVGEQGKSLKLSVAAMEWQAGIMEIQAGLFDKQVEAMERQAKTMDASLKLGLRAYVGVHSIGVSFPERRITLQIENIGKVPAKNIIVEVTGEIERQVASIGPPDGNPVRFFEKAEDIAYYFENYRETRLFPGNLPIQIVIPLVESVFTEQHRSLIERGQVRLIVRGNIQFMDGFHKDKNTPFAFRYLGKTFWTPYPVEKEDRTGQQADSENPN